MNSSVAAAHSDLPHLHTIALGSQGPQVVILHGWGRSLDALRPLGELLADSCKVLLIDLPGFGFSPLPYGASNDGGGWDTLQYAERVKDCLVEHGISSCILIGHSFGGRVSVQLSSRHPDLVRALVLIGSHGLKRKRPAMEECKVRSIRFAVSIAKKIDGLIGTRIFAHYFAPRFGSTDYKAAGDLKKTLVKTVNEDLSEQARRISAPTLLLWGEKDSATPLDLAHAFRALIQDSELHVFPNKGHEPFSDVGAHLMAQYIERFFSKRGLLS
jgi:pimeloyl-ACP methyl ester carboxylesterase